MNVEMYHPTDRANFTRIDLPTIAIYFSYATPIAFRRGGTETWVVRENEWGSVTGKHLNHIDSGTGKRVSGAEFERLLDRATEAPFEVLESL